MFKNFRISSLDKVIAIYIPGFENLNQKDGDTIYQRDFFPFLIYSQFLFVT